MKNLFSFLVIFTMLMLGASNYVIAQDDESATDDAVESASLDTGSAVTEEPDSAATIDLSDEDQAAAAEEGQSLHKRIKRYFIEGGAGFMGAVLLTLIFGLALAIERIIYLNMATTNTEKLLTDVEEALNSGGVEAAKEVCRDPGQSSFH